MAESKNHTNHNQNRKAHQNGIKKPKEFRHESTLGMDPKFFFFYRIGKKDLRFSTLTIRNTAALSCYFTLVLVFLRNQWFCKKGNLKPVKQLTRAAEKKAAREAKA
ncbi:unnamed protein product [Parnassius mnemosyne]|uniref:60S ribosomal protein L29 n=1 Tax=Parnassius mnemosyne TaxID=213953 RepID=A0AAV1MA69_9NEOP